MVRTGRARSRQVLVVGALVLLYAAATFLGRQSRPTDAAISLAWPAAGCGVWFLLVVRSRPARLAAVGGILVIGHTVQAATGLPLAGSAALAVANALHAVLGAVLVRRLLGDRPALRQPGDLIRLLQASAGAAAVSGVLSALAAARLLGEPLGQSLALFVTRNTGATFVLLATVLALSKPFSPRELVVRAGELRPVVVTAACLGLFAFVFAAPDRPPLLFLGMAAAVLGGTSFGVPRAGVLGLTLSVIAVVGTVGGGGPLAAVAVAEVRAVYIQLFTVLLMLVTLMLATLERSRDDLARALAASVRDLEQAHDSALIGKAVLTRRGPGDWTVHRPNPAFVAVLEEVAAGTAWPRLPGSADEDLLLRVLEDVGQGRTPTWEGEVSMPGRDGQLRWTQVHLSVLPTPDAVAGAVVELMDVTARRAARRSLEQRVGRDELTGLLNRAGLAEALGDLLGAAPTDRPPTLLFLDLDRFKSVNDTHGHEAGDRLLVQVAGALRSCVRQGDVAARLGGDEFVVCLVGAGPRQVEALTARLGEQVRGALRLDGTDLGLDVSIGVARYRAGEDAASLVRRADVAMYEAKRARRSGGVPTQRPATLVADAQSRPASCR